MINFAAAISNGFTIPMKASKKSELNLSLEKVFQQYFSTKKAWEIEELVHPLVLVVNNIRPKSPQEEVSLQPLIDILEANDNQRLAFVAYLNELFRERSFTEMIVDVGIMANNSFVNEFFRKVTDTFLPETADPNKMRYVFSQVFYRKNDCDWVLKINTLELYQLFNLLEIRPIENSFEEQGPMWQIYYSVIVIALRASGAALEKNIVTLTPQYEKKNSPFVALYREIEDLWEKSSAENQLKEQEDTDYKQIIVLLGQCKEYMNQSYKGVENYGITLQSTKEINRIQEQLSRIERTLPLIAKEKSNDPNAKLVQLFLLLMEIHSKRRKLKEFVSSATHLVAYEVTSHTAKTGEKYISETKKEYWQMLKSALGGGFIVGILCITKVLISKIHTSEFGYAFLYSMNYAIGFILIYVLGYTLATKQPAMTASTLMNLIEKGIHNDVRPKERYKEFARYFAQLFRTQFIAFVGNVVMAFPVALLGIYGIYQWTGKDIAVEKWPKLLTDLHPLESPAIFHAAIAGVFLFLSGIISGQVANSNKFYGISTRLADIPAIKWSLGPEKTAKLKETFDHKWPGIMSNFWFGVFMGSTASVGAFIGLNLDVRHITFASGNFALGLFGVNWQVANQVYFWSILGIGIIGFMNFFVSFTLSLLLAFKSKNFTSKEFRPLILSIWNELKTRPLSFLFPIMLPKVTEETKNEGMEGRPAEETKIVNEDEAEDLNEKNLGEEE